MKDLFECKQSNLYCTIRYNYCQTDRITDWVLYMIIIISNFLNQISPFGQLYHCNFQIVPYAPDKCCHQDIF